MRDVDPETGRMNVTHKELLGTWEENAARFKCGTTVTGFVRSVESYGIFVELAPNLAGLAEYSDGVEAGKGASVYIKSILPDKMKVKLVLIDSFDLPLPAPGLGYFIDGNKVKHIHSWRYSPSCCSKLTETVFDK